MVEPLSFKDQTAACSVIEILYTQKRRGNNLKEIISKTLTDRYDDHIIAFLSAYTDISI